MTSTQIDTTSILEHPKYMEVYPEIHKSPIETLGNIINKDRNVHFSDDISEKYNKCENDNKDNKKSDLMFGLISKKIFWSIITFAIILIIIIVGFMWWRQRGNNKSIENSNQGIPGPPINNMDPINQAYLPNGCPIPRILPNGLCLIGNNPVSPNEYNQYLQQFNTMMAQINTPNISNNDTNVKSNNKKVSKEKLNNIKDDLDDLTDSDESDDEYDIDSVIHSSINEIEEERNYKNDIKTNMLDIANNKPDKSSNIFNINDDNSLILDDNDLSDDIIDNNYNKDHFEISNNICKGTWANGNNCTNKAKIGEYCGRHDPNKDQI